MLHPLVAEELNPKVTLIIAFPNGTQIPIVHKYKLRFLCKGYRPDILPKIPFRSLVQYEAIVLSVAAQYFNPTRIVFVDFSRIFLCERQL